jgi:hypothetical protein
VGRVATQVPSGLVVVPLRPGMAEGVWESNRGSYLRFLDPPMNLGARWTFRGGRLKEYSFERGGAAFRDVYARAGAGRDRPTRLTIGLNPVVGWAPELEEIDERTVTLWLGSDLPPGRGARIPFSFASPLAGAEIELDGTRWWTDGRRVHARAGAPTTASPH